MRKLTIAMILIILASVALFAEGSQEKPEEQWGPGQGMFQRYGDFTGEVITITGKLAFEENRFPELISGGDTYELMYHYLDTSDLDIKEGDKITVKGYLVPGPRWDTAEGEKHLMLTEATIGGKEYILSGFANNSAYGCFNGSFGPGNRGSGRGSMMGGSFGGRGRW